MKVVLSRKGFDSASGGCPSPILPDGTLLSLPIPEMKFSKDLKTKEEIMNWKTWDNKQYQPLAYSDLTLPSSVIDYFKENDVSLVTYLDVLNELLPKGMIKEKKKKFSNNLRWTCHLDPDLIQSVLQRPLEWRCLFGQGGNAESHLRNHNVGVNDIFLFFGWFRKTVLQNSRLIFDPHDKPGVHLIYGYMQVEYKISHDKNRDKVRAWMNYHPHLRLKAWNNERNAVYVGTKTLSWKENKSGAGMFCNHPSLVLTDTTVQNNPKKSRTHWRAELFPKDLEMTYHKPESHRTEYDEQGNKRKYFKSNSRGQEFIIAKPTKMIDWMKTIIESMETVS